MADRRHGEVARERRMSESDEQRGTARGLAVTAYALLTLLMLLQQPGETTYDTRAELTQRPGDFLAGAFTLWHPESNFGELTRLDTG